MRDMSKKIFSGADVITRKRQGETLLCRGVISACGKNYGSEPEKTGLMNRPEYLFMGSVADIKTGDELYLGEEGYRVISSGVISAFGKSFCLQAVLERML
jgi:hypothetical protein